MDLNNGQCNAGTVLCCVRLLPVDHTCHNQVVQMAQTKSRLIPSNSHFSLDSNSAENNTRTHFLFLSYTLCCRDSDIYRQLTQLTDVAFSRLAKRLNYFHFFFTFFHSLNVSWAVRFIRFFESSTIHLIYIVWHYFNNNVIRVQNVHQFCK